MRPLTYFVACTLDGFIAREDGSFDCFLFEGDHIADQVASYPETLPGHVRGPLGIVAPNRHFDAVLMGRHTYEVGLPIGATSPYPHLDQYVFSHSSAPASPDVHHVGAGDLDVVRALKQQDGLGVWLCGGGKLASSLLPEIDEVVLKVHPVLIGRGRPLFDRIDGSRRLTLLASRAYASGVMLQRYGLDPAL